MNRKRLSYKMHKHAVKILVVALLIIVGVAIHTGTIFGVFIGFCIGGTAGPLGVIIGGILGILIQYFLR